MVKIENNGYGYFCDPECLDVYEEKSYIIEICEKYEPKKSNTSLFADKHVWKTSILCITICILYLYIINCL